MLAQPQQLREGRLGVQGHADRALECLSADLTTDQLDIAAWVMPGENRGKRSVSPIEQYPSLGHSRHPQADDLAVIDGEADPASNVAHRPRHLVRVHIRQAA